jgi:hypothetical protein
MHNLIQITEAAIRCKDVYAESMYSKECTQFNLEMISGNSWRLTYRGTDELGDWIDNFDFSFIPAKRIGMDILGSIPGRISAGFYDAFRPSIKILDKIQPYSHVFVEGHSLGHSLAVYAAAYLRVTKLCEVQGITFGGPRVGDAEFCKWLNHQANITAMRRKGDLVPLVPPYLKGYRNTGHPYGSMPKMLHRAWFQLMHTWASSIDFSDPAIIAEHVMSAYIGDLEALQTEKR